MSTTRILTLLAAATLVLGLAASAGAQGTPSACTTPFDPACNHLKCYQIKDTATSQKTPIVQLDNQFGREVVFRLQPVLLCVPTQKSCCDASGACSAANCQPNPVPAPALPHFKCYRIKAKQCPNNDCASLAKFAKGTVQVNLRDQFGPEGPLPLGNPVLLCAPADKQVVGQTTTTTIPTTTTTVTTTTTTTTTQPPICHFDTAANGCIGSCPASLGPNVQCQLTAPGKCDCVQPPVCCQCPGAACFNTNGQCPTGCSTVTNATCDSASGQCGCGLCRDPANPTACVSNLPCSTSQPCPAPMVCDPVHCPAPCDPCAQTGTCNPVQCLRADGTVSQCHPSPQTSCGCCSPSNGPCTTDFDCCSGICNVASQTCQ